MIKKISLLTLTFISFLFVGMMLPSVHAAGETVALTLNVVKLDESNEVQILPTTFDIQFGQTASLDLSGLTSDDDKIALLHNDTFVANDQKFLLSGSLNVSVIIKNDISDWVAAFVDTNGELLDVVYNPEEAPTTLAQPTKPGYDVGTFTTTQITSDTVFVANYVRSSTTTINVNVEGGTKDKETYLFNDIVTVTANIDDFTHWEDEFGFIVSYDAIFKFSALNDITLTAKTGGIEAAHLYLRDVSGIRTNGDSFLAQIYLPDNYELIEWGFLGSNTNADGQYEPKIDGVDVSKNPNKAMNPSTNEFLTTILGEGFVYTRAYAVVYNNTTEQLETIYSLVRNNIGVAFVFDMKWDGMPDDLLNGVYVVGTFNSWTLNNKMSKDGSLYTKTIYFKFMGDSVYYAGYKFRHLTPDDWTDPEWYGGGIFRSPEDLLNDYGLVTDNSEDWLILKIVPSEFSYMTLETYYRPV